MGTVPVAPNSYRLAFEGAIKCSGFNANPVYLGLNNMAIIYMPTLTVIRIFTN